VITRLKTVITNVAFLTLTQPKRKKPLSPAVVTCLEHCKCSNQGQFHEHP
jgi:hypothetical protein